jgi:nanoRNase/pAp phosphatase (c-di-AMP/oligoRNAs hydrolase)
MRLVTRSDFDGLICAVLLKEAGVVDEYIFVHPKDIQDGKVAITSNDVLANIPFWPGCGLWFDHHVSENDVKDIFGSDFKGESRVEKSCARIIHDYYGSKEVFGRFEEMIEAVDRSDSGDLTREEIMNPQGWILLSFIMDPRTGLGKFKDYRISNYKLMEDLIEYCRTMPIEEILEIPDVKERVTRYYDQERVFRHVIEKNGTAYGNVLVLDLRETREIPVGNRFIEYSMFPEQNISIRVMWGPTPDIVAFAVGHSILNRTSKTNVGLLMKEYGGGGHLQVGTCQVPAAEADRTLDELIKRIRSDG